MLTIFSALIVFSALICCGRVLWTRAEERREEKMQTDLALAGLKRIKEVKRTESKAVPLRRREDPAQALAATASAANVNPAAREIAAFLTKKADPNGPWQRGMRTY